MLLASDQLADKLEVVQRPFLAGQQRKLVESLRLDGKSLKNMRHFDTNTENESELLQMVKLVNGEGLGLDMIGPLQSEIRSAIHGCSTKRPSLYIASIGETCPTCPVSFA